MSTMPDGQPPAAPPSTSVTRSAFVHPPPPTPPPQVERRRGKVVGRTEAPQDLQDESRARADGGNRCVDRVLDLSLGLVAGGSSSARAVAARGLGALLLRRQGWSEGAD
jgi:hypothetical protein